MNDRFEMRWWDTKEKRMIPWHIYERPGYCSSLNERDFLYSQRYINMQCTGLKDKNGKLLYEGDIILFNSTTVKKGKFAKKIIRRADYPMFNADNDPLIDISDQKAVEIIGNIYENPELLNHNDDKNCTCGLCLGGN